MRQPSTTHTCRVRKGGYYRGHDLGGDAIAVTVISGWLFSRVTTREFALERVIDERVTSESVECEPEQTDDVRTTLRALPFYHHSDVKCQSIRRLSPRVTARPLDNSV